MDEYNNVWLYSLDGITWKRRSEDYEKYFSVMDIDEKDKEKRIDFSRKFEDIMIFIFNLFLVMKNYDSINKSFIENQLKSRYKDLVVEYLPIDEYIDDYINSFSEDVVNTTVENSDNDYYLSLDRAMYISENEANSCLNYGDILFAVSIGMTKKTWITQEDKKVRKTHRSVDRKTIPILDYFNVGGSLMLFPKDVSMNPDTKEIVNCRCSIKYS